MGTPNRHLNISIRCDIPTDSWREWYFKRTSLTSFQAACLLEGLRPGVEQEDTFVAYFEDDDFEWANASLAFYGEDARRSLAKTLLCVENWYGDADISPFDVIDRAVNSNIRIDPETKRIAVQESVRLNPSPENDTPSLLREQIQMLTAQLEVAEQEKKRLNEKVLRLKEQGHSYDGRGIGSARIRERVLAGMIHGISQCADECLEKDQQLDPEKVAITFMGWRNIFELPVDMISDEKIYEIADAAINKGRTLQEGHKTKV